MLYKNTKTGVVIDVKSELAGAWVPVEKKQPAKKKSAPKKKEAGKDK